MNGNNFNVDEASFNQAFYDTAAVNMDVKIDKGLRVFQNDALVGIRCLKSYTFYFCGVVMKF